MASLIHNSRILGGPFLSFVSCRPLKVKILKFGVDFFNTDDDLIQVVDSNVKRVKNLSGITFPWWDTLCD